MTTPVGAVERNFLRSILRDNDSIRKSESLCNFRLHDQYAFFLYFYSCFGTASALTQRGEETLGSSTAAELTTSGFCLSKKTI